MNKRKIASLIDDVLQKTMELQLSSILPKVLTLAKLLDDKEFERWVLLETSGYFNTNSALTSETKVPDYRKVSAQYYNRQVQAIIINDVSLLFITYYHIREGVLELEKMSKQEQQITLRNPVVAEQLKTHLKIEIDIITYPPDALLPILEEIRSKLISWLIDKKKELTESFSGINTSIELSNLHPTVQRIADELFSNGHYREAILNTYIELVNAVKTKSGLHHIDNTRLMQTAFSKDNPVIIVSEDSDEQVGFMWLFTGAVMGIRNPKAHRLIQQNDPQRTIEWLSFASVLFRVLDDSKIKS